MTGVFKVPMLDPDSPDLWVENVRDALDGSGMGAVFVAADCRDRTEVPVRVRLQVEAIDQWKMEFAWPHIRRSLNSVPSLFARSGRCKFPDVEGLIRVVLDSIQKRSQGVETRLRDEIGAANLADYQSLASYIADLEGKFSKLAGHGITITQSEQRYLLLRGLTADYNGVRASILGYRDRNNNPADLATAISMLEEYEDNVLASTTVTRTLSNNREITLTTMTTKPSTLMQKGGGSGVCFYFSKRGHCRRGESCRFRHVERVKLGGDGQELYTQRPRMPGVRDSRSNRPRGGGGNNRQKAGTCRNCGNEGHWARDCIRPKKDKVNTTIAEDLQGVDPVVADDWSRATKDYVGHGLGMSVYYKHEKWLVDSASTCMVANEDFRELYNVRPADVTITVGGDNQLVCNRVGNLRVQTEIGPVDLHAVRIVPGFGVNILSGPCLEQGMGMTLSSDGRTWWARRRGKVVLKGSADAAGLYWVTLTRVQQWKIHGRGA